MEGRRETGNFVRTNQQVQVDWDQVNWSQVKHQVESIQQRIFRETQTFSPIGGGLVTRSFRGEI